MHSGSINWNKQIQLVQQVGRLSKQKSHEQSTAKTHNYNCWSDGVAQTQI